jgi:hypothetical protein
MELKRNDTVARTMAEPVRTRTKSADDGRRRPIRHESGLAHIRTVRRNSDSIQGFSQRPHLAAYVRNLCINAHFGVNPTLVRILPLFGGVTHLVIEADPIFPAPLHTGTIFPPLLRLPNLRCLGLFHCSGVPTSFIHSALSSFREVALINVDLRDDTLP